MALLSDELTRTCFVICPIGSEGSPIRKRADQVLRHIIEPAASECGYETIRADGIDKPGAITNQIIDQLVEADVVIADLTEHNPNVMYELAIRHGMRKPVIHIMEITTELPFDLQQNRTIRFDHHDLDSAAACRASITSQIRALEAEPDTFDNPITISFDLKVLQKSEKPTDRTLAEVLQTIQELRSELSFLSATVARLSRVNPTQASEHYKRRRLNHINQTLQEENLSDADLVVLRSALDDIAPDERTSFEFDRLWHRTAKVVQERIHRRSGQLDVATSSTSPLTDDDFDDVPF